MRISGDRVLLIFDDVGVRTRILASDSLSKWFDRVAELNEEDCAMGCWRLCISIFGVPDAQDSSTDSEQMENHPQDAPVEQEAHVDAVRQFDKDKEVAVEGTGTIVAWRENELWEDPKGASYSCVSGRAGATIEPSPMLLNVDSTTSWVGIPIADEVELQTGLATEDSTT
ncbi:hypothetical protein V6N13_016808 [Hibiscus sabdariffa]